MSFSDINKKKIGKNIQHIRKANHRSVDELADLLYISKEKLQHIENGSYQKEDWDDIIKEVSKISGYTFNQIKFDDLSNIEKDALYFEEKIKAKDIFEMKEVDDVIKKVYLLMLPILVDDKSKQSKYFADALKNFEEKIMGTGNLKDCLDTIVLFMDAYSKDKVIVSCVNVLSCLGFYYLTYLNDVVDEKQIENAAADNYIGIMAQVSSNVDEEMLSAKKKEFFNKYNDIILQYSQILNESNEYKDYISFYISTRYQLAMFDNGEVKMSDDEMHRFGESLFNNLYQTGNKYAVKFHDFIEQIKQ